MRRLLPFILIVLVAAGIYALWPKQSPNLLPSELAPVDEETQWDEESTTRIAIWRPYGYNAASMQVCPGQGKCKEISNEGSIEAGEQPYYMIAPRPGELRITPEPSRITYLNPNPAPLKPGMYEDTDQNIRYGGAWIFQQREGPSNGTLHSAMDPASAVSFEFDGTGLELGTFFHDDRRTSRICIDGVCRDIDLFSHSPEWQQPVLVYGLKPGRHIAKLELVAGKAMDLDWIRVIGTIAPFEPGEYLPTDSRWFTTTHWEQQRSTALTAGAAFQFTGHEVALTFPTNADAGEIMLCLDGQCQVEDLFSRAPGERTIRANAEQGTHNVVLQKGPSHQLDLPKVQIF